MCVVACSSAEVQVHIEEYLRKEQSVCPASASKYQQELRTKNAASKQ